MSDRLRRQNVQSRQTAGSALNMGGAFRDSSLDLTFTVCSQTAARKPTVLTEGAESQCCSEPTVSKCSAITAVFMQHV